MLVSLQLLGQKHEEKRRRVKSPPPFLVIRSTGAALPAGPPIKGLPARPAPPAFSLGVNNGVMTKDFLKEILAVPNPSGHEEFLVECVEDWCRQNGIKTKKDGKGNLFLTKGHVAGGQYFPAMTAHLPPWPCCRSGFCPAS